MWRAQTCAQTCERSALWEYAREAGRFFVFNIPESSEWIPHTKLWGKLSRVYGNQRLSNSLNKSLSNFYIVVNTVCENKY